MRLAVIGGGYVGSCLIDLALKEHEYVKCVDNFHKGNCDHLFQFVPHPSFEFVYGDINHVEDIPKMWDDIDVLINTAAIVGFPACKKHQVLARHTHVNAVRNLLKRRPKDKLFIACSTDSCYGINDEYCTEETPLNPQSLYGETKVEMEKIVLDYDNVLICRFSTGMGVSPIMRCNLLVNDLVYTAVKTGKLEVFEPNASRSFINVFDMGRALLHFSNLLYKRENKHRVYNIGSDDLNYTKGELAKVISNHTGCTVDLIEGKDIDCRDYKISHDRQQEARFKTHISMSQTIQDLIAAVPLIEWQRKYQ